MAPLNPFVQAEADQIGQRDTASRDGFGTIPKFNFRHRDLVEGHKVHFLRVEGDRMSLAAKSAMLSLLDEGGALAPLTLVIRLRQ